ncbi:type II toxin-antitoxin system VapC family toxin [Pedobacter punctiformis]|uniref:Type II toxin-antitoxin system VapC family toxin n=1 Tax=Pedobacter punctiformis TaxID=3004097 RepID=A0ABT4LCE6_9SPHI|nr:type II toxin-antitoxin system VapC family toxin [Pedobacter sp. HCMS5-2]MCZ4244469.1 type II toxin-antitoxin system VapC family toxin [Pedobacter sp. HCMS5-2]
MENQIIMVDTSILIDYFRKKDKSKTKLFILSQRFENLCISSITEFEIYTGAKSDQLSFWKMMLSNFIVFPFDSDAALIAVEIQNKLKKLRKAIDKADLFIASTAVAHNLTFDTLNQKHFKNIEDLKLFSMG